MIRLHSSGCWKRWRLNLLLNNQEQTALYLAVKNHHKAIVRQLLKYHVDTSVRNAAGQTAADIARQQNSSIWLTYLQMPEFCSLTADL